MVHGDARDGKWRGKMWMEWVASNLALDDRAQSIQVLSADPHSSTASSRLNWHPRRFKWTRPFRWKIKSGFCACAITFRTCYTKIAVSVWEWWGVNKYTHEGLNARYEVFTVVLLRIWFLWVVIQCHCVSSFWRLYMYSSKDAVSHPKRTECLS